MQIDFVIPWVDGSDPEWQEEKALYSESNSSDNGANRYRGFDNLQYWFRGIEKFAPWVNKVHFITWGHIPDWLDTTHPKLNIVRHEDYMPEAYRPTFNARPIEVNLHRIRGLSEHFVYFNDDTFITKEMKPSDFFKNGLPLDIGVMDAFTIREDHSYSVMNSLRIINKHFDKKQTINQNKQKWFSSKYGAQLYRNIALYPWKYFTGFITLHLPEAYNKSTFEEVWEKEPEILDLTSKNKFRTKEDVTVWLMRFWRLAKGEFYPHKPSGKYYSISSIEMSEEAAAAVREQKYQMVCLNDVLEETDFEEGKQILNNALDALLPAKSAYEK